MNDVDFAVLSKHEIANPEGEHGESNENESAVDVRQRKLSCGQIGTLTIR